MCCSASQIFLAHLNTLPYQWFLSSWRPRGLIVPDACKDVADLGAACNIIHLLHINLCQSCLLTYFMRNIYGCPDNIQLKLTASQLDAVWNMCFLLGASECWKRRLKLFPVVIFKHCPGFVWWICFHQMRLSAVIVGRTACWNELLCVICQIASDVNSQKISKEAVIGQSTFPKCIHW